MKFCIDASILEMVGYPPVLFIDRTSIEQWKAHLAVIARYFKKEMKFDNLQFDESMYDNEDFVGFLFLERAMDLVAHEDHYPNRVVGGGVLVEHGASYELDWVWLHPFSRNRGLLRNSWKTFARRFGQFSVATPLSVQMSAFLEKHHQGVSGSQTP